MIHEVFTFLKWLVEEHFWITLILVAYVIPSIGKWLLHFVQVLRGQVVAYDDDEDDEEEETPARVNIKATNGSTVTNIRVGRSKKAQKPKKNAPRKPRIRVKEGQVFHVTDAKHGTNVIVHATDEAEAKRVAAVELRVEEEELDATEVYDRVIRK